MLLELWSKQVMDIALSLTMCLVKELQISWMALPGENVQVKFISKQ